MSAYGGRGLHGQVVDALGSRILRGQIGPGELIDPDAVLAEFGVSRTVVREAFKVLAAKGLVDARPRTGTYVTKRSRWQLLDADVMAWRTAGSVDPLLLTELGEVRQIFEPHAAAMAAQRRSPEQIALLEGSVQRMRDSQSHEVLIQADLDFHRLILAAAGNELLQRIEVILEPALRARDALMHSDPADFTFVDEHGEIFRAIADGDSEAAFALTDRMMCRAAEDVQQILQAATSADG
ncbi:GntR family transcriptional regulator [Microbacterium sp. SLBN-154]|uniref:FadR/GntR family transcriptional regulator n=1 Tax=Microbacterium sp. SLBN-154 TaxID=2768458 RepID=UPI00114DE520|nr:FadR/GntR family transcriptional regulator [Microbacterium sp. SLBN-154]TQK17674.1 GntR family transcriptional regulator [Microbacterium sp. SLBN-154]